MARPPHVDQDRIDDAYATALDAMQQPVNTGRIVKACETVEEALAELRYFNEPVIRQDGEAAAPPASPNQPDAAPAKAASAPRQAPDAPRRRKDEAAPPSAWRILRPGKADITAPDGTKWLKWWTDRAAKAQAENRRDELRALQDANAAAWDAIALASPETEAVMAQAAQAVRAVLDA